MSVNTPCVKCKNEFLSTASKCPQCYHPRGKFVKRDTEKPRTDLLSTPAILGLASVLRHGAKEYAAWNWTQDPEWSRLCGAAIRHLLAFQNSEDIDPDSGLPHIDHLMCCAMFLSDLQKNKIGIDDRRSTAVHGQFRQT